MRGWRYWGWPVRGGRALLDVALWHLLIDSLSVVGESFEAEWVSFRGWPVWV